MGMRAYIKIGGESVDIKLSGALAKAVVDLSLWDPRESYLSLTTDQLRKVSNILRGIELEGIDRYKRGIIDVWLSSVNETDLLTFV